MKKYDIIIAGAGASGVFMSYELTKERNNASVLMLDKGAPLEKRICPIKAGKTQTCIKCSPCLLYTSTLDMLCVIPASSIFVWNVRFVY